MTSKRTIDLAAQAAAHQAHIATGNADVLRQAADQLDALWALDESRGLRDGHGSAEYQRVSLAPRLRAMADKVDGPVST